MILTVADKLSVITFCDHQKPKKCIPIFGNALFYEFLFYEFLGVFIDKLSY